jgi:VanZ family protein
MFALMCAIIVAADLGLPLPLRRILSMPMLDKLGHLVLYGLLSWLVVRAALEAMPARRPPVVGGACATLLVALTAAEEFSQRFVEARTFSWGDLAASSLGILVMAALSVYAKLRSGRPTADATKGIRV